VAWVLVAREVHRLFVERRRGYRGDAPVLGQPRRPFDVAEGRVAGPCVQFAEGQILGQFCLGDNIHGSRLEPRVFGSIDDVYA
jgi:hypothetical protein